MTHHQEVILGVLLGLAFGVVYFYWKRRQRSAPPRPVPPPRPARPRRPTQPTVSAPYPYIRGTALYWRSRDSAHIASFVRQAQGLPPYHVESQWRDPPG
jgi:hypothetical protein